MPEGSAGMPTEAPKGKPWGKIAAVVIVLIVIIAAIVAWRLLTPTSKYQADVFTEATFGEPDSLDPAYDYETSGGKVIQNVAETLIWYQGGNADVFMPMLATKVPDLQNPADVSPDGMTYNFTLKSGVTFHSGNPVNCRAVEFSIERVLVINFPDGPSWILDQSLTNYASDDPSTPGVNERLVAIQDSVTCPAGGTGLSVQFHLAIPYPAFISTLAFTVGSVIDPAPASYHTSGRCASTDLYNNTCHDQLVATGPFKLRVWTANQEIILDRNPTYHRAGVKPVAFREVHIVKVNDIATRVLMLKAGDADAIDLSPDHKGDIRATDGSFLPGLVEYSGDTFIVQFLGFNQNINMTGVSPTDFNGTADFFQDIHMRKAFSYAWKYDDFINNVLFGYGTPLCGPIPKGMFGYDATTPCYSFDLTKAQAEFQQALDPRTPLNLGDTYWDNGFTITLTYNVGNLPREEGARQLAATLTALNPKFVVKVQGLEWAAFLDNIRFQKPPFFFLGWAPDYADPDDYVVPFLKTNATFPKRVGYSNTTLDALIDSQSADLNPTSRRATLRQIQLAPYYDVPYIWRNQAKSQNVFRTWVQGYYDNPMTFSGTGNYYYDLSKAATA
ncbi:MAG TPA: ABC transporter substrate-binding protein [Thermoplasmata archaeon]|nr:ABC transporter substrate-binding protein [Thermoplasmata archaeon]